MLYKQATTRGCMLINHLSFSFEKKRSFCENSAIDPQRKPLNRTSVDYRQTVRHPKELPTGMLYQHARTDRTTTVCSV